MFCSYRWLPAIKAAVLILHAEDDKIVPYALGHKLFDAAKQAGKNNIRYHIYIYSHTSILNMN